MRYAWDGVSGDPLTRQFSPTNATILTASSPTYTPTTLLAGVTNFDVNYLTRSMGTTAATPFIIASPGTAHSGHGSNLQRRQHALVFPVFHSQFAAGSGVVHDHKRPDQYENRRRSGRYSLGEHLRGQRIA